MTEIKKHFIRTAFILLAVIGVNIAAKAQDKIEGQWFNAEKTGKVEIKKDASGKFNGKVVWLKEPLKDGKPKLDEMNTNEKLRTRPRLGLPVLNGFVKDGDNKYVDGTIYDPQNGKTYSCKMTLKGNSLDIRGYIGISLLGRTTTFTRAD
ncbi:DUF2147 domain-containing protein [Mucilaginibacter myungsuensis]|uniref:DUF2147 domain-containing protein n=1 Tax=Mucilaginibacter myungsuensis TaxID=649104 RepID=A0A929KUH7_9SPHI|nr:DUF2147 domain-containing protein [Mucilaginibacter myungsuensis]MBE9660670.1 DUF2147 domain-containing protein [Mucilaginibacter myungsuensis]MDN3600715.1 DUF2147 domain-containing protein [Mucilaginibacter myungsuensis]